MIPKAKKVAAPNVWHTLGDRWVGEARCPYCAWAISMTGDTEQEVIELLIPLVAVHKATHQEVPS